MIPLEHLDSAQVPGGDELRLMRRGSDFMITLDRNELMNSRMSGSEEALATMTAERLAGRKGQRWLVGGYGMGFTLRAALGVLGPDALHQRHVLVDRELEPWVTLPLIGDAAHVPAVVVVRRVHERAPGQRE